MYRLFLLLLLCCNGIAARAQYFDTLHIRYAIGEAVLQREDLELLDSLAHAAGDRKLLIYSYADYLGSEKANQHLSDNRARTVKDYLLQQGIKPEQVMECTGLGRIAGSGGTAGNPLNRRTDIFIRKNKEAVATAAVAAPVVAEAPQKRREYFTEDGSPARVTKIDIDNLNLNDALRLQNISFVPGQAIVRPVSYPEMENLYNVMYDNPTLKIRLEGHVCCCIYPDGYFEDTPTWALSVQRAYVVYKHLTDRGIDPGRMQYKGFGRTRPIMENETTSEEGQINRRVEVRILAK
jgi:outer membrane protein OmpA-like peptidoglycan-associated protein